MQVFVTMWSHLILNVAVMPDTVASSLLRLNLAFFFVNLYSHYIY